MSNPDDPNRKPPAAPSWVDEVLGQSRAAPAPDAPRSAPSAPVPAPSDDLRLPEDRARAATPAPSWVDDVSRPAATQAPPQAHVQPQPQVHAQPQLQQPQPQAAPRPVADDDWVSRATGNAPRNTPIPQGPAPTVSPTRSDFDTLGDSARQLARQFSAGAASGDVAQKKLIAGLLGIILGSLGIHKFYLGLTTPGVVMLGVNIGAWVLAILLGILTLGAGLIVTVPLAALVSGAIGLLGLVEGILYLTKSDADFQRDYVLGKKPWL